MCRLKRERKRKPRGEFSAFFSFLAVCSLDCSVPPTQQSVGRCLSFVGPFLFFPFFLSCCRPARSLSPCLCNVPSLQSTPHRVHFLGEQHNARSLPPTGQTALHAPNSQTAHVTNPAASQFIPTSEELPLMDPSHYLHWYIVRSFAPCRCILSHSFICFSHHQKSNKNIMATMRLSPVIPAYSIPHKPGNPDGSLWQKMPP